jgi:hypothetical protein
MPNVQKVSLNEHSHSLQLTVAQNVIVIWELGDLQEKLSASVLLKLPVTLMQ